MNAASTYFALGILTQKMDHLLRKIRKVCYKSAASWIRQNGYKTAFHITFLENPSQSNSISYLCYRRKNYVWERQDLVTGDIIWIKVQDWWYIIFMWNRFPKTFADLFRCVTFTETEYLNIFHTTFKFNTAPDIRLCMSKPKKLTLLSTITMTNGRV